MNNPDHFYFFLLLVMLLWAFWHPICVGLSDDHFTPSSGVTGGHRAKQSVLSSSPDQHEHFDTPFVYARLSHPHDPSPGSPPPGSTHRAHLRTRGQSWPQSAMFQVWSQSVNAFASYRADWQTDGLTDRLTDWRKIILNNVYDINKFGKPVFPQFSFKWIAHFDVNKIWKLTWIVFSCRPAVRISRLHFLVLKNAHL